MKLIVIGGVAGGASAAAKARRMDESAEIIMFERGEYISFANCGLPYHVGEVIADREALLVMTPEGFKERTNIDVRVRQEVTMINRDKKSVTVQNHATGESYEESYDKLILAPGSSPFVPPTPGADLDNVLVLWTMNDMDKVKARVDKGIKNALVVGGGFIGIEVAENLVERGIKTDLIDLAPQVLAVLDEEMTNPLAAEMMEKGICLQLGTSIKKIEQNGDGLKATLSDDSVVETDLIVMAIGVRPNSELAEKAGLELSDRKGIIVNDEMQTSDPDIYAVGDAIVVKNIVLDSPAMIPLAGPANKQGRIAAINAMGGKTETYKGSLGTSVCKIFNLCAASVGPSERILKQAGKPYKKMYLNPNSHASYYPGAAVLNMKVLFDDKGYILGAQIVGLEGADKRIDVLATAIRNKLTLTDLEELELAYSPPYGSAKDPINFVGFVGNNILRGDTELVFPNELPKDALIIDVREEDEYMISKIEGAINIPMGQVRDRLSEIPKDKEIVVYCKTGIRAYLIERVLKSHGYNVKNLAGGFTTWGLFNPKPMSCLPLGVVKQDTEMAMMSDTSLPEVKKSLPKKEETPVVNTGNLLKLDVCGRPCPGPIVAVRKKLEEMSDNDMLEVVASDAGFYTDLPAWCESTGNKLVSIQKGDDGKITAIVQKGNSDAPCAITTTNANGEKETCLVVFSNDLDKAMAAFIIATGFATLGHKVTMFFTFWGLNILRKDNPPSVAKDFLSKMFGFMMPRGANKLALSKMHMMGMGTQMMKYVMNSKNVDSLPVLIKNAQDMGVKFLVCEMAMDVMGLKQEELIDGIETAGVAKFAAVSEKSASTLFI